jgi:hypothetical protein
MEYKTYSMRPKIAEIDRVETKTGDSVMKNKRNGDCNEQQYSARDEAVFGKVLLKGMSRARAQRCVVVISLPFRFLLTYAYAVFPAVSRRSAARRSEA